MDNHEKLTLRSLASFVYSLHHASKYSPIIMNFSEEFTALELPIIKKLEEEGVDHASLTQIVSSYSKAQLGSVEFYSALEKFISSYIEQSEFGKGRKFKPIEIANLMYSYAVNETCSKDIIDELTPLMVERIPALKARELR
jgi:hypothetical protein